MHISAKASVRGPEARCKSSFSLCRSAGTLTPINPASISDAMMPEAITKPAAWSRFQTKAIDPTMEPQAAASRKTRVNSLRSTSKYQPGCEAR